MNAVEPGRVVQSRAGRDKGKLLVVLRVEGEYAYLADGKLRKSETPKRKKIRHLLPQKECLDNLLDFMNNSTVEYDAYLRKQLSHLAEQGGVN